MTIDLSVHMDSDQARAALAKLSGKQAKAAYALAVRDTGFEARRAMQREFRKVFDKPTPFIMRSVAVDVDDQKLTARITPSYFGREPLDPQQVLQAQEFGGQRAPKRFELALQAMGALPAGWYVVPGKYARRDAYGNMERGQLRQILAQLRLKTEERRNRKGINAQRRAGGTYFVVRPGGDRQPGIYQREFMGRGVTPVLIFVSGTQYRSRLGMDRIGKEAGLDEYLRKRVRYRVYQATEGDT